MKKKGFRFKRAVSLLLAAAMIVTAAPQTSLTALAAEPGAALENPDDSEDLEAVTVEDSADEVGDTGDNGTFVPSDDAEGTEVGGDGQPADSEDGDQSEDAGEGTEDPADPDVTNQDEETADADQSEEGDDAPESDETAGTEEDADNEPAEDDETEIEVEEDEKFYNEDSEDIPESDGYYGVYYPEYNNFDATTRDILEISDTSAKEAGTTVEAILKYYADMKEPEEDESVPNRFDEVRLNFDVTSSMNTQQKVEAKYVNAAIEILNNGGSINYSINSSEQWGVSYNLQQPTTMVEDFVITFTAETIPYQGVLISLSDTKFPAEGIYVNYMFRDELVEDAKNSFWEPKNPQDEAVDGQDDEGEVENKDYWSNQAALFAWNGSVPTGAMDISEGGIQYSYQKGPNSGNQEDPEEPQDSEGQENQEDQEDPGFFLIGFSLNEAVNSQSGVALVPRQQYLFASVHDVENLSVSAGDEEGRQVKAGARAGSDAGENISNVAWKAFDESIIKIANEKNATATLQALAVGTTYYYVTYKVSDKAYSEIYRVATNLSVDGKELHYVGDVSTEDDGEFKALRIDERTAKDRNSSYGEADSIPDILAYYEARLDDRFDFIEFSTYVGDGSAEENGSPAMTMKKEYINGAQKILNILDTEESRHSIGYGFQKDGGDQEENYPRIRALINFWHPKFTDGQELKEDISLSLTVENRLNQGVLFNISETDFPAEGLSINYQVEEKEDTRKMSNLSDCLEGAEGELVVLSLGEDDQTPTGLVETYGIWFNEEDYPNNGTVYVSNLGVDITGEMQANQNYLITPLYRDEKGMPINGTKEVTAGARSESTEGLKDITWGSLNEELLTIESGTNDVTATLKAGNKTGTAYYYVTYVSENKTYLELHEVRTIVATKDGVELTYVGETINEEMELYDENGSVYAKVPYRRLRIEEWRAGQDNPGAGLADILTYYAEQIEAGAEEPFTCVQFDMLGFDSRIKAAEINGAVSVLKEAVKNGERIEPWIDYNYWQDDSGVNYSLSQPREVKEDFSIDATTFTAELMPHQGVKVKAAAAAKDFPAEYVSVSFSINQENAFVDCFDLGEDRDHWGTDHLRLMALEDGEQPGVIEPRDLWTSWYENRYDNENEEEIVEYGSNFGLSLEGLEAGRAYLITPIFFDEEYVPMGGTREIHAGLRSSSDEGISSITWKSLDEGLITITPGTGADATLAAGKNDFGTAYYSAEYTSGESTYLELHSVEVTFAAFSDDLAYLGEVIREYSEDGIPYLRLRINGWEAIELNKDADITDILAFYKDSEIGIKFSCVELNLDDDSLGKTANSLEIALKKEYLNGVFPILDWDNEDFGPWIDYNVWHEGDDSSIATGVNFTLSSLKGEEIKEAVGLELTVSAVENQGLRVKFDSKNFPADYVSLAYGQQVDLTDDAWIDEKPLRLFAYSSDVPTAVVGADMEQCWSYYSSVKEGDDTWSHIYFNNIVPLGTTEYLATYVYEDEEKPVVGEAIELKAGKRAGVEVDASSATWKSFDTDRATIDNNGKLTAWSADGEVFYYVTYTVGGAQFLEMHVTYPQSPMIKELKFDRTEMTLNYYPEGDGYPRPDEDYLQLQYLPANTDTNDRRIRWEIDGDENVISFIYDEGDGLMHGGIRAEGEGTVTVRAHYLDGEYDYDGNFVPAVPESILATAECTVKVIQPLTWNEMQDEVDRLSRKLYALMSVDTYLRDVEFPEEFPGWTWNKPDTALADYKDMADGYTFAATYTKDENHTFKCRLWVNFVTPTGIALQWKNKGYNPDLPNENENREWFEGVPEALKTGDDATLGYQYIFDHISQYSYDEDEVAQYNKFADKLSSKYTNIVWTTTPAGKGSTNDDKTFTFRAASEKAPEKQTVTVSVKDGSKVLFKDTRTIIVTKDDPYNMDAVEYVTWEEVNGVRWLILKVWMPKEEYETKQLTVVSEDTAILKLNMNKKALEPGEGEESGATYVKIPFTQPKIKYGTAWIKVIAPDGITRRFCVDFIDTEPKVVSGTTITLNKQSAEPMTVVTIRTHYDYTINGTPTLKLDQGATAPGLSVTDVDGPIKDFREWNADDEYNQYNVYNITIAMTDKNQISKGKHTLTLDMEVNIKEPGQQVAKGTEEHKLKLTLNVTDTKPKVTFKQTKKFNNFYTDEEADGILTVTSNGVGVKNLELTGSSCNFEVLTIPVFDEAGNEVKDENGDTIYEENRYRIVLKTNSDGTRMDATNNRKGVLKYRLEGFSELYEANFTVSVENKKPTLVLPQKSDTLYPTVGYKETWLWIADKSTWEGLNTDGIEVSYVKGSTRTKVEVKNLDDWWRGPDYNYTEGEVTAAGGNNNYYLAVLEDGNILIWLQPLQPGDTYKPKSDTIKLEIKEKNWSSPVTVSYSMKVDNGMPKLTLGQSTLTLNKNDAVYRTQQGRTTLRLKGSSSWLHDDGWNERITFAGEDDDSRDMLVQGHISLYYWGDDFWDGEVVVRLNDKEPKENKTYNFKVSAKNGADTVASTTLKVKIVDKSVDQCLKVKAKGSINLMDREDTYIAYTPKLSNLSGEVVGGYLVGEDADMFRADWDWETGRLLVRAQRYNLFSTKMTYEVQAVFFVQTPGYHGGEIRTDANNPLKIKVKQGKPKLKATIANNTIYRQLDNSVEIKLSAAFNKKDVEIERVELLNYTDDFHLEWEEADSVRLVLNDRYYADKVVKNGKTWKVKLAVRYREQAGNTKSAQVTCSIVVR